MLRPPLSSLDISGSKLSDVPYPVSRMNRRHKLWALRLLLHHPYH